MIWKGEQNLTRLKIEDNAEGELQGIVQCCVDHFGTRFFEEL